jgi:type VI protein secretion system component VasF
MVSVRKAKEKQDEKLGFVPVWPLLAALVVMGLVIWFAAR